MSVEALFTKSDLWFRNEDKTLEFTVTSDGITPVDITGWAITFALCTVAYVNQFSKTVGSGITITDAVNGVLEVLVLNADTAALAPAKYLYDLARTDSGDKATLAHGSVVLQRGCA